MVLANLPRYAYSFDVSRWLPKATAYMAKASEYELVGNKRD